MKFSAKKTLFAATAAPFALAAALSAPASADAPTVAGTVDNDVEDIRAAEYGDDFNGRLASDYRDLAVFEADVMVDWIDAEWFAERAKASANGEPPELAQPEEWGIESERRMQELKAARAALVSVFDGGAKDVAPDAAAYAQASYDCWVEQQEEGWQDLHIALCRNQFLRAARALDVAIRDDLPDLAGRLFFEFDEYDLTPEAREKLAAIAADLRADNVEQVVIVGHADTVGTDEYNYALSESRAKTVANALTGMGVADVSVETDVTLVAEGETAPLIETGEGVRMPLNRRVAIFAGEPSVGIATR